MKKIITLLTIGFIFFVSCSKDDDNSSDNFINKSANQKPAGTSSNDLLSDKKFKSMVIEIIYVDGFEPSAEAITNFVSFVTARTNKPAGITVLKRSIPSPGKETFTVEDVAALDNTKRTKYNTEDQIAVSVLFLDGKSSSDTSTTVVLGMAYRNTSFVIFEQTVRRLSDSPWEPERSVYETTVITHEFAHILGLTNLGAPMQSNHEDSSHPKHCNVAGCLMHWEAESEKGLLSTGTAPQLDTQCLADLRANGGK